MTGAATGRNAVLSLLRERGDLGRFLSNTWANDDQFSREVLAGAVGGLVDIVSTIRNAGVGLQGWHPAEAEYLRQPAACIVADITPLLNTEPTEDLQARLTLLAKFAVSANEQGLIRITETPASKAQTENVQKVQIVGLPDRVTETVIDRDRDGNISESRQFERDAA